MAFADYLDLRTAVIEQCGYPDIADVFDRLTLLSEVTLNRLLETRDQVQSATVIFAGGNATLPDDFHKAIGLYTAAGVELVQQPLQITKRTHTQYFYAVDAGGLVSKHADGDLMLEYYAKIPTLTTSMTTTNWLLENYPSVYLYAVAYEAAKYKRDRELAADMKALRGDEIDDLMSADFDMRYSRARVRVAGVTP